jgi:hypothetical protein
MVHIFSGGKQNHPLLLAVSGNIKAETSIEIRRHMLQQRVVISIRYSSTWVNSVINHIPAKLDARPA